METEQRPSYYPPATQPPAVYPRQLDLTENQNKIMTVKEWLITYLILLIPVGNIIFLFIWAFGDSNDNPTRKNWAKAMLIWMAIVLVLYIIFLIFFMLFFATSDIFNMMR